MTQAGTPPELCDAEARVRALSDLDSSLLVEAGAGTGKTSLLAARVTMLLLRGTAPERIAAITFTEAAASELAARVHEYIGSLLAGSIPAPLRPLLGAGIDADQRAQLTQAVAHLDGLTTATIHGFCQILLADFAVEADIDPGAQIIDEDMSVALFERCFDAWLTRRLSVMASDSDPILHMTREDPRGVVALFRDIARRRRRHRTARVPMPASGGRPDIELIDAIDSLKRWYSTAPAVDFIETAIGQLEALSQPYVDCFAASPDFATLWRLAHPPASPRRRRDSLELAPLRTEHLWRKAAGADAAPELEAAFQAGFARVDTAYRDLLATIAALITGRLSQELDEVLSDYAAAKRAAAVLDFDDLLEHAVLLVRSHAEVRAALAARFTHILVDEFQDTDPVQCDIIFRLSGRDHAERWEDVQQRPGALFLVGDPKQSLFLFRGAAIQSYEVAKAVLLRAFPENVLQVTANFRTVEAILTHVNQCFSAPLSAPGQPGYVALGATRTAPRHSLPCAAKLTLQLPQDPRINDVRDAEAQAVASLCQRLVGGLDLAQADGSVRKVTPGDIALLAPVGTELQRYERALQDAGLPYASKAGNGFYRRQEVQDLVSLTRLLADPNDTLALGAFLRGPMIGFTDEALLDATTALPRETDAPVPHLSLRTPPEHIADPDLRCTMEILGALRRRARYTTPSQLLLEAVERLAIRVVLSRREPRRASAANSNVDLFLQRAAAYGVRGLRRFAQDVSAAWAQGQRAPEGHVDAEGEAIELVSIHSAKGLEWPIVIPINTASSPRQRDEIVHRPEDDTLHWTVGGIVSPDLTAALAMEAQDLARERVRLLYVACTRAKDLLILPRVPNLGGSAYAHAADLGFDALPELDLGTITGSMSRPDRGPENLQDGATFAEETARIARSSAPIAWLTPSAQDLDRLDFDPVSDDETYDMADLSGIVGAGRERGLVLHKLIEEVLWEGLDEAEASLVERARVLLDEIVEEGRPASSVPDPREIARTVLTTLALPDVATLRPNLVPEVPIHGMIEGEGAVRPLAGRADALVIVEGSVTGVIDWKSDVAPGERERALHVEQLRLYLAATGVPRGALVYASLGVVRWVDLPTGWRAF